MHTTPISAKQHQDDFSSHPILMEYIKFQFRQIIFGWIFDTHTHTKKRKHFSVRLNHLSSLIFRGSGSLDGNTFLHIKLNLMPDAIQIISIATSTCTKISQKWTQCCFSSSFFSLLFLWFYPLCEKGNRFLFAKH